MSEPKRGEVYLVNFDSTIGAEIKKVHPVLILQNKNWIQDKETFQTTS